MALLKGIVDNVKAGVGTLTAAGGASIKGVMQNQFRDYFEMDSMDSGLLVSRGYKREGDRGVKKDGTRVNQGDDHIIVNGSVIAVADGQCAMIIDGGRLVELCAEPGEFTWEASTAPSMFTGNLGESIINTAKAIKDSFVFGGEMPKSHRIYYINTKEIINNQFGFGDAPFRIQDDSIHLKMTAKLSCNGRYTYRIADPLLFYKFTGNVTSEYRKSGEFDAQIKTEFISAFRDGLSEISRLGIMPEDIKAEMKAVRKAISDTLEDEYQWYSRCGLELVSVAVRDADIDEASQAKLTAAQEEAQKLRMTADPGLAASFALRGQTEAMIGAANNSAGAMIGVAGMNMFGGNAGGGGTAAALQALQQNQAMQQQQAQQQAMFQQQAPAGASWQCSCGTAAVGNFCTHCGKAPPAPAGGWTCAKCSTVNAENANFCPGCGGQKPAAGGHCKNCGVPVGGAFCASCGTQQ